MPPNIELDIFLIGGTLLTALLLVFILLFILLYRKAQLNLVVEKQIFTQALLQTEVEIREQTLQDVSRELHDNFGQVASLVKMNLLALSLPIIPSERELYISTKNLLGTLINDMRELSHAMKANQLHEIGLEKAIKLEIEKIEKVSGLAFRFSSTIGKVDLAHQTRVFLFRMFQEIMQNTIKHANATEVEITLVVKQDCLLLRCTDNGLGFNESKVTLGNGLKNIEERCAIIKAKLKIDATINNGTDIEIALPLTSKANA